MTMATVPEQVVEKVRRTKKKSEEKSVVEAFLWSIHWK
jgi:hypothetical protein